MVYAPASHNRTVYASPPAGGLGCGFARSLRYASLPRKTSATVCRPWKCYTFPYSGRQTVANSRNVMRHASAKTVAFIVLIQDKINYE
jgi:hypothetical protein